MRYFLGLDVAKDSFAAALLDEAGQVVSTASFSNNLEGFSELLAWLQAPAQTIGAASTTCARPPNRSANKYKPLLANDLLLAITPPIQNQKF